MSGGVDMALKGRFPMAFYRYFLNNIDGTISINNYIHVTGWDIFTHPYPTLSGGLAKAPLNLV